MREIKMKWMWKFVAIPMLVFVFAFLMPANSQAAEEEVVYETIDLSEYILQAGGLGAHVEESFDGDGYYTMEDPHWFSSGMETVEDAIYYALKNKESSIDISSYGVKMADFSTIYYKVINLHPDLFYARSSASYTGTEDYVTTIWLYYNTEYTDEDIVVFNQKVEEIIAGVDSSWPDIEKILYLHDYMVTNIEYDETYSKYNAYNALVEGSCVCNGYSLAFLYLMNNIGVNVDFITSWDLNHAWNLVELDGEYFYVDVTWDDPLGTDVTYCGHRNFMVSKEGLIATGHNTSDWITSSSNSNVYDLETSSRYVDCFWSDVYTAVPLAGTRAGYLPNQYDLSNGKINVYDFNTHSTSSYDRHTGKWTVWGYNDTWYDYDYCSMVTAGNAFYYTTHQDIYRMDLDGTTTKVYTLSSEEISQGYIYGLTVGETLSYILKTEPGGDITYVGNYNYEEEKFVSSEGFVYKLLDYNAVLSRYTSIQIIGYEGASAEVVIPGNIDGYIVDSIGDNAFSTCENMMSISVPLSVTDISTNAFESCNNLVIKGYKGSYVETYASNNGFAFERMICSNNAHSPATDDGDCTTAILCSRCSEVTIGAKEHDFTGNSEYSSEDGYYHRCKNIGCRVIELHSTHTPIEDDCDCTTASYCIVCYEVITEAMVHDFSGEYSYDEEYHWITCLNDGCQVFQMMSTHLPVANDDGDCTTAIPCTFCGAPITKAMEHDFSGEYLYDEEGHWHICANDSCYVTDAKSAHVPATDDGDYTTPITCTACDFIIEEAMTPVEGFVTRMYKQCLSRTPDQAGLEGWVGQLEGGYMDGAAIAQQFVFSNEMLSKNLSNRDFVMVLYRAMMGREADETGLAGWVAQLDNRYMTRSQITKSFVESKEFTNICASYGISRGTYDASMAPIEQFVTRFYILCLERNPDQAGLYGWVGNLKNKYMNGAQIANSFFFSNEFINRNVSDEKYIELLYNTLMGRPSDERGKAGWLSQLQDGHMNREGMMKAFIESVEFSEICEKYGISRGSL